MVDRFLAWFGAGVLVVGVSAGLLAGAAVAAAQDGGDSDGAKTSQSESTGGQNNSTESTESVDTRTDTETDTETETEDPSGEAPGGDVDDAGSTPKNDGGGKDSKKTDTTENAAAKRITRSIADDDESDDSALAANVIKTGTDAKSQSSTKPEVDTGVVAHRTVTVEKKIADDAVDETAPVTFAAAVQQEPDATATASPLAGILDVVGTIVFGIYGLATQILGGPPILPANSAVSVRSSTLVLECGCDAGDTVKVQADWYVPDLPEGETPERLVYLQHGFLARGPWYSHTAANLAEQTKSIVVAPSITSNFLAADACWLGGSAMHEAMAALFDADNTALADSAAAAGYTGPIPDRVVLVGHSLGGGAVIGMAGAMADRGTDGRLAGVVMLDGVPLQTTAVESISKVNPDIPIYQLGAPRYFWNQFGVGADALQTVRPGQFIGVTLVNGSHVDPMRGGNPLIQLGQELVAGFVRPENGDAAHILMVQWVNDMFDGIGADPITEEFTIDTPSGPATAVPLPNDLHKQFFLNPLQGIISGGLFGDSLFTFEPSCVQESLGTCTAA